MNNTFYKNYILDKGTNPLSLHRYFLFLNIFMNNTFYKNYILDKGTNPLSLHR